MYDIPRRRLECHGAHEGAAPVDETINLMEDSICHNNYATVYMTYSVDAVLMDDDV